MLLELPKFLSRNSFKIYLRVCIIYKVLFMKVTFLLIKITIINLTVHINIRTYHYIIKLKGEIIIQVCDKLYYWL